MAGSVAVLDELAVHGLRRPASQPTRAAEVSHVACGALPSKCRLHLVDQRSCQVLMQWTEYPAQHACIIKEFRFCPFINKSCVLSHWKGAS